jgi:restriction endonuclease S subunit
MSNLVPEGWESKQLIECSFNGISNGVFCDPKNVGSGYKLINVYDMYQGYGVNVNLTRRLQLTEKEFLNNKVKYGDVFFTRSSLKLEGIAYCNINLSHDDDITYDGHLMKIRPNTELVNAEYLARYCLSDFARTYFMSTAKHSTMTTIAQADIAPLQVLLPPLPEQQKIAQILTSVDEVIEKTQAQIDKLKDLKTAMMQELLTKGIGHLEFKDSPVGRIPVGWEVVPLEEIISTMAGGVSVNSENKPKVTGELGILKTSAVAKGEFKPSENKVVLLNEYERLRTPVLADHIIFSRMNTPALVGESGYVNRDYDDLFLPDRLWQIDVQDRSRTSVLWLSYVLSSDKSKAEISELATGTSNTMKNISKPKLLGIKIAYPKFSEQIKIAASLQAVDKKLDISNHKLKRNIALKKALMQDLLTGKVRVNAEQSNSPLTVG